MGQYAVMTLVVLLVVLFSGSVVQAQSPNDCPEELFVKYDKERRLYGYVTAMGEWKIPSTYIKAYPFNGKYAPVLVDKKYGVIDCNGYLIIAAQFDAIAPLLYGRAFARNGDAWTYIDASGRTAYNGYFEDIKELNERNALAWVKSKGKWGLFSKDDARIKYQPTWDAAVPMSDSCSIVRAGSRLAIFSQELLLVLHDSLDLVEQLNNSNLYGVKRKNLWGVVHAQGHWVVRPAYDSVKSYGGMAYLYKGGKVSLANPRGRVVQADLDELTPYAEKLAVARKDTGYALIGALGTRLTDYHYSYLSTAYQGYAVARQQGKYGFFLTKERDFVGPPIYEYLARVGGTPYYLGQKKGLYFFVDPTRPNDVLERQRFDSVEVQDSLSHIRVWQGAKVHFLDVYNAKLLNAQGWASAMPMRRNTAFVKKDSVLGIWNTALLMEAVVHKYDTLFWLDVLVPSTQPLLYVRTGTLNRKTGEWKYGVADLEGRELLPMDYERIEPVGGKLFKVLRKGKWGSQYAGAVTAVEQQYDYLSNRTDALAQGNADQPEWPAIAQKKGGYILINDQGKPLTEGPFSGLTWKGEGIFVGIQKGRPVMLTTRGVPVKTAEPFDSLGRFVTKLAPAMQAGKWGFMTFQGKYAVKPLYDEVLPYGGRVALVRMGNKWGSIDRSGRWVSEPKYKGWEWQNGRRRLME